MNKNLPSCTDILMLRILELDDVTQKELLKKYRDENDEEALEKLTQSFTKLVIKCANDSLKNANASDKYSNIENLISVGFEGLLIAFQKFDFKKDNKLSTYVVSYLNGYMKNFLLNKVYNSTQTYREFIKKRDIIARELQNELLRDVSEKEIYEAYKEKYDSKITYKEYMLLKESKSTLVSLEDSKKSEASIVKNITSVDESYKNEQLDENLRSLIDSLPEPKRTIILKRYGFEGEALSCQKVANLLGISKQRVNQLEHEAMYILKKNKSVFY